MPSLERAYAMFLRCHHIVAGARTETDLGREVCRAAVDELGYVLAWVGLSERDERVRVLAHAGYEDGYLERIVIVPGDLALGHGPTGTAIRERRPAVCRDIATAPEFAPWRDDALARGYGSSAAIPLLCGSRVLGALNLYAKEPGAFDEREIALLEEVALDVALGLVALRYASARQEPAPSLAEVTACAVAASVAHDLQNMLGVVLLSLSDLAKRLPEGMRDPAWIDANEALRGGAELTRQMLLLSKRAAGANESVELDSCLRGLHPLLTRLVGARSRVTLDLNAEQGRIALAPIELQRVVINLVLNASQAAPRGVAVRIETRAPDARTLVLSVHDDGPGIAPDVLEHVFEPSFSTKGAGGLGLGLASVAQLVDAAGGRVRADSEIGAGATFTIVLPRLLAAARAPVPP